MWSHICSQSIQLVLTGVCAVCAGEQGSEQDDGLVFLYKLCRGAAPKSYGLQVWFCFTLLHVFDILPSQTGSATISLWTSFVWLLVLLTEQIVCCEKMTQGAGHCQPEALDLLASCLALVTHMACS